MIDRQCVRETQLECLWTQQLNADMAPVASHSCTVYLQSANKKTYSQAKRCYCDSLMLKEKSQDIYIIHDVIISSSDAEHAAGF